jgi:hypothetical protein
VNLTGIVQLPTNRRGHRIAVFQLGAEMEITVMTSLPTKRDMDIQAQHNAKVRYLPYFCGMQSHHLLAVFFRRVMWLLFLTFWVGGLFAKEVDAEQKEREKARKAAQKAYRERLKRPINGVIFEPDSLNSRPDSASMARFARGVHFSDSIMQGKFDSVVSNMEKIHHGSIITYKSSNPFDPFKNQTYYRRGQGKFWYFGLGLCLLLVIIYFKSVFPKQFELRIRGVLNPYYYNELMNDKTITQFGGGSSVVFVFTQAVFAAGILLNLILQGYLQLNSVFIFVFLYLSVLFGVLVQQTIQFLFASSVHIETLIQRQIQRIYNINFMLSLICFPLFLVFYYNSYKYPSVELSHWVSFVLVLWVVIRSIYAFVGLFQDRQFTFLAFLYFCTLEILPYSVLFAILSRS